MEGNFIVRKFSLWKVFRCVQREKLRKAFYFIGTFTVGMFAGPDSSIKEKLKKTDYDSFI